MISEELKANECIAKGKNPPCTARIQSLERGVVDVVFKRHDLVLVDLCEQRLFLRLGQFFVVLVANTRGEYVSENEPIFPASHSVSIQCASQNEGVCFTYMSAAAFFFLVPVALTGRGCASSCDFLRHRKTEQMDARPQMQHVSVTTRQSTAITTDGGGP